MIHMCGDDGVPVTAGDENKEHMNTLTTYGAALHVGILGAKLEYVCAWCGLWERFPAVYRMEMAFRVSWR